ncbi:CBS domain-containing protein [Streptomyces sp. Tu 2975]|uniref:CBS domain-containing protein n=1 Tax=Streptomyces sp. Tu 2975 TaxID=2676871 RepID=UPI00135CE99F|nr:CBS domain-containing protein [Streptomyces sp. Tu 2975]QIP87895.1 CBS domain-containing protein [Streptomyces sp. Tu 2975]
MRARDLAEAYPHVTTDDGAMDAARMLAGRLLPALLVLDADGHPYAIVPGSQLVRQFVPPYILEDPRLAAVVDERPDSDVAERLAGLTAAEWAPRSAFPPPVVGPDARPMEVAALMARTRSPLVAVIERDADGVRLLGTVTAARLVAHFLGDT